MQRTRLQSWHAFQKPILLLIAFFSRFRSDRGGNVAITFALAMLPIVGLTGMAVDYSRGNSAKASMQAALDAAALTLSKEAQGMNPSALGDKAKSYFLANFNRPDVKNVQITPTYTELGNGQFKLTLSATAQVPTTITGLWQDKMNIASNAQVLWGYKRLELALALDNTGSMSSSNKMTNLKPAAKNLVTTLQERRQDAGRRQGLAHSVRHHRAASAPATRISAWFDVSCSALGNPQGCNSSTWKNYWEGCVRDRTQPYDSQDTVPNQGTPATLFPIYDCGSLVNILPLTYDWNALNDPHRFDAAERQHQCHHRAGLGLACADAGTRRSEASAPKPDLDKVIILLTDGDNTEAWNNSNNTKITSQNTIDARTKLACTNIKAANIKLYTIRVINGNANLLRDCATNPTMYLRRAERGQLSAVFSTIAQTSPICGCRNRRAPHPQKNKARRTWPGFSFADRLKPRLLRRRELGQIALVRLVGFLGEVGIEFADLGRLGHEALIGALEIVLLDFDRLLDRLRAEQLLERRGAVLERLLRIVDASTAIACTPFETVPNAFMAGVHAFLAEFLEFVELLGIEAVDHDLPFAPARKAAIAHRSVTIDRRYRHSYVALHKKSSEIFALQ